VLPRLFQFGPLALPTYGAASAIALLVALNLAMRLAPKLDLPPAKIWNLGIYTILAGLIASRLLMVVTHLSLFRYNPLWLLGLSPSYIPWIPWTSAAIALAVAWLYSKAEELPLRATLDAFAPALAAAFAIQSIGAYLAGAAYGTPTHSPLSITYSSRYAALLYQTPLHIHLVPVQLYQAIACIALLAALLLWLPRRRQPGELAGIWLLAYGLTVFFLQFYRGDVFTNGLFTPMQRAAIAAVILSAVLLWKRTPSTQPQPIPTLIP
jgi:phosphatidylglycerol:prolipoprotein diacylglycerol transferase